jgi:hypothetical protein
MEPRHASLALRRALAFALDWLVLAVWGGLLFGAVMVARGDTPYDRWAGARVALRLTDRTPSPAPRA